MDNSQNQAATEFAGISIPQNRDRANLVNALLDNGRHNEAQTEIQRWLTESPDDFDALFMLCRLSIDTDKAPFARPIAVALTHQYPGRVEGWTILGMVDAALERPDEALKALQRAEALRPGWPLTVRVLCNVYVMLHRFDDAKAAAEKALEYGEHYMPHVALAFYHLQNRNWKEGFKHYTAQMGRCKDRNIQDFGLKPWAGKGSVLIYGEQGLGDQLAYTSAIDQRCKQLVCHPKLGNLLKRSLDISVYPDQFKSQIDWQPTAYHQASMSEAMQWQTVKPRGRWLKPHPEKKVQWQALMYSKALVKDRPWVGIGWTGGRVGGQGWRQRNLTEHDLAPILDLPFNFVSLEYRPHASIPSVHSWPWATQTDDLDDFAALVDCLDVVVCVPTTAYHVAGSLGIPCHVIVHDKPHFHEGHSGDCPWWESVKFHRRTDGLSAAVNSVVDSLRRLI